MRRNSVQLLAPLLFRQQQSCLKSNPLSHFTPEDNVYNSYTNYISHAIAKALRHTVIFLSFSDRQARANSVDPDQTAPRGGLIRVCTVCHSLCIFWMYYSMVKPPCSNFRVITANFSGVQNISSLSVLSIDCYHRDSSLRCGSM